MIEMLRQQLSMTFFFYLLNFFEENPNFVKGLGVFRV